MILIQAKHRLQKGEARLSSVLFLLFILSITWVLWSGLYKPLVVGLGVFFLCA